MEKTRRSFLKKAATAGAITAVGIVVANAKDESYNSGGVVVGKSKKQEILYKKTKVWDEYYRNAL